MHVNQIRNLVLSVIAERGYPQFPWRRKPNLTVLVGATEIARLVKVSNPAVVTNWRSRSPDFPLERSGGTQPKFDLIEVLEWLRLSGREVPPISATSWWRKLVRAFALQAAAPAPRATMVALLVLHRATRDSQAGPAARERWASLASQAVEVGRDVAADDFAALLVKAASTTELEQPELRGLLSDALTVDADTAGFVADLVDALDRAGGAAPGRLLEPVLDLGRDGRARPPLATGRFLADVMVALADVPPGGSVLDPAAGEGTLLLRCAQTAVRPLSLYGQEVDEAAWKTARSRMFVEGIATNLGRPGDDSLRIDQHRDRIVDAVLIDPPLGDDAPPLHLWVEHGLMHLRQGGRLVIALPLHALVEMKVARRRPDKMLRARFELNAFDAVITGALVLPRGLRPDVIGPLVVIEMRRGRGQIDRTEITAAALITSRRQPLALSSQMVTEALRSGGLAALAELNDPAVQVVPVVQGDLLGALSRVEWDVETSMRSSTPQDAKRPAATDSLSTSLLSDERDVQAALARIETRHDALRTSVINLLDHFETVRDHMPPEVMDRLRDDIDRLRRETS
jgi:hypothetical protein